MPTFRRASATLVFLWAFLPGPGCKDALPPAADPTVSSYLMPPGRVQVEMPMERLTSLPGSDTFRQPRKMLVERSREGVVYRVQDRRDRVEWRSAGQLFFTARPDGAYLVRQFDNHGQAVGVKGRRLMFPWPAKAGDRRQVRYRLHDGADRSGSEVRGTVTVLREGFALAVAGQTYEPCLEVHELLDLPGDSRVDLRSVFCRGIGRVRIEQRSPVPTGGDSIIVDQITGVGEEPK